METPDYTKMSFDELHAELKKLHDLFLEIISDDRPQCLPYINEKIDEVLHFIDIKLAECMRSATKNISN